MWSVGRKGCGDQQQEPCTLGDTELVVIIEDIQGQLPLLRVVTT